MNTPPPADRPGDLAPRRRKLLKNLEALTDTPMTALAFVWLGLLIFELTYGLSGPLVTLSAVIWVLFIIDFVVKLLVAPDRWAYLRQNWLTAVALLLPALRGLRALRAFRLLRWARAGRSLNLVRLLTSLNRGLAAARRAMARRGVGYVAAATLLVLFGGAAGMLSFERPDALREAGLADVADRGGGLGSYGEALWWTAMVLTTMGTDYWPRTAEGRALCLLLSLYAFAMFGYLAGAIASHFVGRDREDRPGAGAADLASLREEVAALRSLLEPRAADRDGQAIAGGTQRGER